MRHRTARLSGLILLLTAGNGKAALAAGIWPCLTRRELQQKHEHNGP